MNPNQTRNQFDAMDIIDLLSLIIGIQNMIENRAQSAANDVQAANQQQAEYLLNQIKAQFEKQNDMLHEILDRISGTT